MFSKNVCILVLWTNVASALVGVEVCTYCRMANFSVSQFFPLILHLWVFPFLIFAERGHMFFFVYNFPVVCRFLIFSPDMYCIVFFCVVYSRLKAFGKKRENRNHGKISHSTESVSTHT